MRKWNQFVWLCVQVLNIFIKTHLTMDSIVVYGDGNVAFFQVLLLLAVPKKTMQSVFGNITNLRWPLLLVPLLCELPRSNTGLKKRIPKNYPTCQVKEDLSGQLVRGQPMLIGEPTCNKRRLRIEISVQGHLESYVFLEKGSGARWVL